MTPVRALVLVAAARRRGRAAAAPVRGVALGLFAEDAGWSYRPLLDEIAAAGADHVELVVPWYQADAAPTDIVDHPRFTPPPATRSPPPSATRAPPASRVHALPHRAPLGAAHARRVARHARARAIAPPGGAATAPASSSWRASPPASASPSLSVGSELSTLDGPADRAAWAATVADVRARLPRRAHVLGQLGPLPRRRRLRPRRPRRPVRLLRARRARRARHRRRPGARLARHARRARALLRPRGRPIVFTELGYRSIHGAGAAPWDEGDPRPRRPRRAAPLLRRLPPRLAATPRSLGGVYFWNWYGWGGADVAQATRRAASPPLEELRAFFRCAGRRRDGPGSTVLGLTVWQRLRAAPGAAHRRPLGSSTWRRTCGPPPSASYVRADVPAPRRIVRTTSEFVAATCPAGRTRRTSGSGAGVALAPAASSV